MFPSNNFIVSVASWLFSSKIAVSASKMLGRSVLSKSSLWTDKFLWWLLFCKGTDCLEQMLNTSALWWLFMSWVYWEKMFYAANQDHYFQKYKYAHYLVLFLQYCWSFLLKFYWGTRHRTLKSTDCTDSGVVINHHFILQYFFKLCWSCYYLLFKWSDFFFSCNAGFFSQQYRAQELCGTISKWCQYPPRGGKKKRKQVSRLLRKVSAFHSRILTHSNAHSTRQPVTDKHRTHPAFSWTNIF